MKIVPHGLFLILTFTSQWALAQLTCSSLFIEKPSFEQQYQSVIERRKLTLAQDFPLYHDDPMTLKDLSLKQGQEFLVRLVDLNKASGPTLIPVSDLSTHAINGIRYIAFKILDLVSDRFLIEIPQVNSQENQFWVPADKLLSLKALSIKAWDRRLEQVDVIIDGYHLMRPHQPAKDSAISLIDFQIDGRTAEVEFSSTSYLYRQNHLFNILLKKFISEHPEVNRLKAELVGTNNAVFLESLFESLTGKKVQVTAGNEEAYASHIQKLIRQNSEEQVNTAVENAIRKTPMYQSAARFGFTKIENIKFSPHPERIDISFEVTLY